MGRYDVIEFKRGSMAAENRTEGFRTPVKERFETFNVCFGGALGVGKTTLFDYLKSGSFIERSSDEARETGVDVSRLEREVDGTNIKISLWDTGGLEKFRSVTENYFRNAQAVILVFKMASRETLDATKDWLELARGYAAGDVLISLWGHERDDEVLRSEDQVDRVTDEMMKGFASANDIQEEMLFVVNAKTGENVDESFGKLIECLHRQLQERRGLSPSPENGKTTSFRLPSGSVPNASGVLAVDSMNGTHETDRGNQTRNVDQGGCALKRC